MNPDIINAGFELSAGGAVLLHCQRLYQHKQVRGLSIAAVLLFTVWGFWNVYYYSALEQPLSFWAGLGVVALNTVWVALALYYLTADERASRRQFEAAMGGRPPLREVLERQCPECDGLLFHGRECRHGL